MLCTAVFSYFGFCFMAERLLVDNEEVLLSVLGEVPALIAGVLLMDRVGRRKTLTLSFALFAMVCALLCVEALRGVDALAIALVFVGRMLSSLAFMTLFIYFSEFYPTAIRATAIGGASSLDEISKIASDYLAEDIETITMGMALFGLIGLISMCTAWALPIETLGRQLEDEVEHTSQTKEERPKGAMKVNM